MSLTPTLLQESFVSMQEAFRQSRDTVLAGIGSEASSIKADTTPVTEIDTAVELFIIDYMKRLYPSLVVLGEEGGYDAEALPVTCWLIDPIDGTKSYIRSIPAFTGMAVLIHEGAALASVIYDYSSGDMYTALQGEGSYKNDHRIELAQLPMPHTVYCKDRLLDELKELLSGEGFHTELTPSGAGFGFMQVVNGESAGRFHLHAGHHIHDHAPGALLVQEAGGEVIPVLDPSYSFRSRSFVACHPDFAPIVRSHLQRVRTIEDPKQALAQTV